MNFFICGFTGAGKTTFLGELKEQVLKRKEKTKLVQARSIEFIDLDDYILRQNPSYSTLVQLIEDLGFEKFRQFELDSIKMLCLKSNLVLALGGGTLRAETIKALSNWKGFWLNVAFESCYARIKGDELRPIATLSKAELEALYDERCKYFSLFEEISGPSQVLDFINDQTADFT